MNKTPDKIKKGLNEYFNLDEVKRHIQCCIDTEECLFCTFFKEGCDKRTFAKLMKGAVQKLEAERDVIIRAIPPRCKYCVRNGPQFLQDGTMDDVCRTCFQNDKCNWQWRGVQKEGN